MTAIIDIALFISPAILAQTSLYEIAGTGVHRYRHFLAAVDRFHDVWRATFYPRILKNEKFTFQQVDRLPKFEFQEEPQSEVFHDASTGLLGLAAASLVVLALTTWALRRFSVVSG